LGTQTVTDVLCEAVAFVLEVEEADITADSTLSDLGIDSLTGSQLLIEIEIRLGREVPFEIIETMDELVTLADFGAAIEHHMSGDVDAATSIS
jgi:acyl carrier protein